MKLGNVELDANKTNIMAIMNLTPDSFFDGGRFFCGDKVDIDKVLIATEYMIKDGADVIDIGGESTRPGFKPISEDEELERVMPALKAIKSNFDIPVSIDTYKPEVARIAVENGVNIVNDIGFLPSEMLKMLSGYEVGYILMHNRYVNSLKRSEPSLSMNELCNEINDKLLLLKEYGYGADKVIIDPGIGFGKSNSDDIMILRNLSKLKELGYPTLLAASNKSCIDYVMNLEKEDRLEGTLAITAQAFYNSINFIRVHDVRSNALFLRMLENMN